MGRRAKALALAVALAAVAAGAGGAALALRGGSGASLPAVHGTELDRAVPSVPLADALGRRTTLAAYRGKYVVLSPFLTLCHEVCPLTTTAFEQMRAAVRAAGLGDKVVFLEVSVDPWRDTPARVQAFAKLTHPGFPLLTGSAANLGRFWKPFGVGYWKTPQDNPPDTDWLPPHRALTFDVSHTNAVFFLDPAGHLRILTIGVADLGGKISGVLASLLNDEGHGYLEHPDGGWTVDQALGNLGRLVGRPIPSR